MNTTATLPPLCLQCAIANSSQTNSDKIFNVTFAVQSPQFVDQGVMFYDSSYIKPGMWYTNVTDGKAWRIVSIDLSINKNIFPGILEDVDYYNCALSSNSQESQISAGPGFIFELAEDGLPNLVPILGIPANIATNLINRFRSRNIYKYYVPVNQTHNFNIGDIIYLNIDGLYYKVTAANRLITQAIGIVTSINNNYYNIYNSFIEELNYFSYKPFGEYITKNTNPALQGPIGTIFYLDNLGNFTSTPTSSFSKPLYIVINANNDLILLNDSYNKYNNKTHIITIYCINGVLSSFTVDNSISDISRYSLSQNSKDITIQTNNNFILPNTITIWGRQFNNGVNDYTLLMAPNNGGLTITASNNTFSMSAYSYSNLVALLGIRNPPIVTNEYIASQIFLNIYN